MSSWAVLYMQTGRVQHATLPNGKVVKLAYKPNPVGHCSTRFGACPQTAKAVTATLPDSVDLREHFPAVFDQGQTGACTGHGFAAGVYASFHAAGIPLPFVPSPKGIYSNGRAIDRIPAPDGSFPPLTDDGAMPNQVERALEVCGVKPIQAPTADGRYSDVDVNNVNLEPTLGDLEVESLTVPTGIRSIADGDTKSVCASLAAKYTVGLASFVDTPFMAWTAGSPPYAMPNYQDSNGGGHWITVCAYMTLPNGKRLFRIRNSWGDWGDAGDIWVTEAFVAQATDKMVYLPNLRAA